ncbi:MAG: CAP domain-containing protein [Dehalococcoidia bacterium]|nr:CAP domain-containing protein [Dehalococcoidia bacterium]
MSVRLPLGATVLAILAALVVVSAIPASAVVTPGQQTSMLAAHNTLRRDVAAAETARLGRTVTIPDLTWDASAAAMAQSWANQLIVSGTLDHNPGRGAYGENLATYENTAPYPDPDPAGPDSAFAGWKAEQANYQWDTNTCTSECGHYKQAVWATATSVGCGVAYGPGVLIPGGYRVVWACYYSTAATDGRPYEAGAAATATSTGTPAPGAGEGGFTGSAPARGLVGLLVTSRASTAAGLSAVLSTAGCSPASIAVLEAGVWKVHVVGAPSIVNAAFPSSLPAGTPFFVRCQP